MTPIPEAPPPAVTAAPSTVLLPHSVSSRFSGSGKGPAQRSVDGYLSAYLHTSTQSSSRSFFGIAGPYFLLGSPSRTTHGGATTPKNFSADAFLPQLIQELGNKEIVLAMYRKLRDDVVAEVLCRLVLVDGTEDGAGGGAAGALLFFEPVSKSELGQEALVKLEQMKGRLSQSVKVTTATEIGCLVLVSTSGRDGRRFGTNPEICVDYLCVCGGSLPGTSGGGKSGNS